MLTSLLILKYKKLFLWGSGGGGRGARVLQCAPHFILWGQGLDLLVLNWRRPEFCNRAFPPLCKMSGSVLSLG